MQYQAIPVGTQAPPNHPGGVINFDRTFAGADLGSLRAVKPDYVGGVDFERMNEIARLTRIRWHGAGQQLGVLGNLRRDEHKDVESVDPYVRPNIESATLGGSTPACAIDRARAFARSLCRRANGDDSGATSFSATNPTAGSCLSIPPAKHLYCLRAWIRDSNAH